MSFLDEMPESLCAQVVQFARKAAERDEQFRVRLWGRWLHITGEKPPKLFQLRDPRPEPTDAGAPKDP